MKAKDPATIRRRLSRLGKGKRRVPQLRPQSVQPGLRLIHADNGCTVSTRHGEVYLIEKHYSLQMRHGGTELSLQEVFHGPTTADILNEAAFKEISSQGLCFVDTETTGLAGGAGTLAFLIGVGNFADDGFVLRQYFLRDPAEEAAMLHLLGAQLKQAQALVTYNGKTFDVPLLEGRFIIAARERRRLGAMPHLDLLHLSRRLWRKSLPDCKLGTVETQILGVERTGMDVPGAEIPGMYMDYLRTGRTEDMYRVIYHNEMDILSLVTLTRAILQRYTQADLAGLAGAEALAIARWHQQSGRLQTADSAYQQAVRSSDPWVRREALRRSALQKKRAGEWKAAVAAWQEWQHIEPQNPEPCIELAKYAEWRLQDPCQALSWAQAALKALSFHPADWRRARQWDEVEHRMRRLKKKMNRTAG